jgi:hypothetical protein
MFFIVARYNRYVSIIQENGKWFYKHKLLAYNKEAPDSHVFTSNNEELLTVEIIT